MQRPFKFVIDLCDGTSRVFETRAGDIFEAMEKLLKAIPPNHALRFPAVDVRGSEGIQKFRSSASDLHARGR